MNDKDKLMAALISAKKIQIIPIGFNESESESENRPNEALDYFEEMELMGLEIESEREMDGKGVRE